MYNIIKSTCYILILCSSCGREIEHISLAVKNNPLIAQMNTDKTQHISYIIATYQKQMEPNETNLKQQNQQTTFLASINLSENKSSNLNSQQITLPPTNNIVFKQIEFEHIEQARQTLDRLYKEKQILFFEPNQHLTLHPKKFSNPRRLKPKKIKNHKYPWWIKQIKLTSPIKKSHYRPIVAVLDSGIDLSHSALQNSIWKNKTPGIFQCGYDLHGCNTSDNFTNRLGSPNIKIKKRERKKETTTAERIMYIHGTHTGGIISGKSNSEDYYSICPQCLILPIKVVEYKNGEAVIKDSSIIKALYYISLINNYSDDKIKIINMSFGKRENSRAISLLLDNLNKSKNDVLVVASAGNSNSSAPIFPASLENVLSVGATSSDGSKSSYSNYGPWVNVSAPGGGRNIAGKYLHGVISTAPENIFIESTGTSIAAPIVSGLAGLLLSINKELSPKELSWIIKSTAKNKNNTDPTTPNLINAKQAIELASIYAPITKNPSYDNKKCGCNITSLTKLSLLNIFFIYLLLALPCLFALILLYRLC
jgi:hypothetical protein